MVDDSPFPKLPPLPTETPDVPDSTFAETEAKSSNSATSGSTYTVAETGRVEEDASESIVSVGGPRQSKAEWKARVKARVKVPEGEAGRVDGVADF